MSARALARPHHIQQRSDPGPQRVALQGASNVNGDGGDRAARAVFEDYFQGVTGGTLSVAGGISTVLKSAGLTISRYSMSGE